MARVLIVDDGEAIRDLIKEVLMTQGHEFDLAANGVEAFEILRQNPKTKGIKVLMCTGSSVTKEIDEAFNAGADDSILKPLSFPALIGKVAEALPPPAK